MIYVARVYIKYDNKNKSRIIRNSRKGNYIQIIT